MNIYYLQRFEVHALPAQGLMRVHLHGVGHGWRGQVIKQKEFVNLPLREQEPVRVTIRRAVAASPNVWKVSLLKISPFLMESSINPCQNRHARM